jgi:hypothetical protein
MLPLSANIGDNSPQIPSTWNTGHPRFPIPSNTLLTNLFTSGTPWTNYQNSANAWDNCVTFSCGNASTKPAFYGLLVSYMAWKQNHGGTCVAAPCTTWKTNLLAMEQLGPVWFREWTTTATGTGDGAGNITFPGANLTTACNGGSCTNFILVATGFRYILTVTGPTTATVARLSYDNTAPYTYGLPNGSNLTFNVINCGTGSLNLLGAALYAVMYDWIFADFSSAQQQYMAASLSNYMTEMENQYAINYFNVAYGDTVHGNGAQSWEGSLNQFIPAMAVYNDTGGVNTIGHLRWTLDYLFNVWLPIDRQMGFDGGQLAAL